MFFRFCSIFCSSRVFLSLSIFFLPGCGVQLPGRKASFVGDRSDIKKRVEGGMKGEEGKVN